MSDGEILEVQELEKRIIELRKDFKPGNPTYDLALKEGRVVFGGLGAFEIPKELKK